MYTSIVVPLDGSDFGALALPLARMLACRSDASLHLVHVRESAPTYEEEQGDWPAREARECHARGQLDALATELATDTALRIEMHFLDGPAVPALQAYLATGLHDLVVMMTHGRGGISRFWLGNVADGLIRQASIPLLLLRHDNAWLRSPEEPLFRRVLVPLDGSPLAEAVLDRVLSLATPDVTVHVLLTVIVPPFPQDGSPADSITFTGQADPNEQQDAALVYLHRVAEDLRMADALVEVQVDHYSRNARGILDAAEAHRADLIALSTHGRGSVSRLVHGNVADKVVRGAQTPVFLYRPSLTQPSPGMAGQDVEAAIDARYHGDEYGLRRDARGAP